MSQIFLARDSLNEQLIFQDLYFVKRKATVNTSVKEVNCVICKMGLEDGVSVTARKFGDKMKFFCQYHMAQE